MNTHGESFTHALLERCVPPSLRQGSHSALRKARLLGGALIIGPTLVLLMCVLLTLIDPSNFKKLLPLYAGGAGFWVIFAGYWYRGAYQAAAHCSLLLKNSLILYFCHLWGVGTPLTVWVMSSMVFSVYLLRNRAATFHLLYLVAGMAVLASFEYLEVFQPTQLHSGHEALMSLVSTVLALCFTLFVTTEVRYLYNRAENILDEEARTDSLTQIANRRQFFEQAHESSKAALENDWAMAVILIDMDHFKRINDNYGHGAGDQALQAVAKILRRTLPAFVGLPARIAGDEFAALIPHSKITNSLHIAESIRKRVENTTITIARSRKRIRLSVSIGVAEYYPSQNESIDDGLARADQLLYNAKDLGRNRVSGDARLESVGLKRSSMKH